MLDLTVLAITFGLVFVAELPDKTTVAGLVLGTRYPWRWVYAGTAAAFLTHVVIAVIAGSLLAMLPQRPLDAAVAALFLLGAVLIWREGNDRDDGPADLSQGDVETDAGFWKVAGIGYGVVFVAELGDLTQILTANLAAKYGAPLSVGLGSVLALWSVGLLAILGGKTLLRVLPLTWITRAAAVVMVALGAFSLVQAVRG